MRKKTDGQKDRLFSLVLQRGFKPRLLARLRAKRFDLNRLSARRRSGNRRSRDRVRGSRQKSEKKTDGLFDRLSSLVLQRGFEPRLLARLRAKRLDLN